jgi:hypothetical protein
MSILPPNACGLPQCIQGARRETAQQKFAYGAGAASGGREGGREGGMEGGREIPTTVTSVGDPRPSGEKPATSTKKRGWQTKVPDRGSAEYSIILARAASFAVEINCSLQNKGKTIWSYGMQGAAKKQLEDQCVNGQFAKEFKRMDGSSYSGAQ